MALAAGAAVLPNGRRVLIDTISLVVVLSRETFFYLSLIELREDSSGIGLREGYVAEHPAARNGMGRERAPGSRHGVVETQFNATLFMSAKGLHLPRRMSYDKWSGIGRHLASVCSSSAWCLGDWLVYGEVAFNGRYRDAVEQTSLDYQTLRNYAWVVRQFPLSRRRDKLSFGHHAEVAALSEPEQDFWLQKAEDLAWSVKLLRREVRTSLRERSGDFEEQDSLAVVDEQPPLESDQIHVDTVMLSVRMMADHLDACHVAARKLGLNLDEWAGMVLVRAALPESAVVTA